MIKNIKKSSLLIAYIMLILCLFSCSVKEIFVDDSPVFETTSAYIVNNAMADAAPAMRMSSKSVNNSLSSNESLSEEVISNERKVIKNYSISGETKNFDNTYESLKSEIKKLDGVVDHQSIENQRVVKEQKQRYLYTTVRIPVENADKFNKFFDNNINVLSRNESQEDITDNYNDTKLRIEVLKEEQQRLYELFQKATTVDELVKIENRMSEITYEIQRLENRINNYDKKVDYSTFIINISEVVLFTEPTTNIPSNDDLIIRFNENFEKCKLFIIGIGIYIFTHLPAICLCLLFVLIILIIIQLILKKSNNKEKKNKIKRINKNITNNIDNTNVIDNTDTNKEDVKVVKVEKEEINQDNIVQTNNTNKKISIPKTTHYGDVAVRVMSDAEIEHDKQLKTYEDEKYNEEKNDAKDVSNETQLTQAHNILSQDITDIKTLMEQKVDE